ncbi:elongation factor P [Candidatus Jorgensenbacteria bacterium CG10_big_fil_rev_8_21_14_0_10_54_38]|uniref:Elongation factor P n=2 Tax=Candidatus Joergenseniibacteriota TaxID=1752739 RepID=A0A2M6WG52_9BACT|nr:MAG: elongation factor P [Candidatus Jorgensenbacteria bacterium CG23_combo_of_CG06-09_8_20_14_all_54_14]PIT91747.1 MAG: elongation factor P [Candidatus Jorgensenbacteria bacterium CG10_big_fil_rev_8_21_14_0_10_54_38]
MLNYNELKVGTIFTKNDDPDPYEVLEYAFIRMQQRKPVTQLKIKNLITGKVQDYAAHQNESFYEADINAVPVVFIYHSKDQYWFHEKGKPAARFFLADEAVGDVRQYLKNNTEVKVFKFAAGDSEKIINIELPVKMDLKVTEAPPAIRGDTAQGGTKSVTLETGAKANVPLFINEGDVVRVNTTTGEYVERVEKA